MKKESATEKVKKTNDSITNDKTDTIVEAKAETAQKSKSLIIKLEDLVPFKDHPYKVVENEGMIELTESISEHGILNPLLVRPLEDSDGKYEIISGHRRFFTAQKLGMKKVQCTVHHIDHDAATVMMVDSNCQRTELLPSEKAFAYNMKMEAIKRMPGRKPAENGDPVGPDLRSAEKLAEEGDDSPTQIKRFIRLTHLVPELLQFVDEGKIGLRPAVEMSYLDEEVQRDIVDCIDERQQEVFPSHAQARRIRGQAENGTITYEEIATIMDERKPNQVEKVKIPADKLRQRIGKNMTDADAVDFIFKSIDYYNRYLQKQRDRDAR